MTGQGGKDSQSTSAGRRSLRKFIGGVWWCARHRCLTWNNVKASWAQSEPGWADRWLERFHQLPPLTDEEWEEWQKAMEKL